MNYTKLTEALEAIKNGRFTRVAYETELPVKNLYKKANIHIVKECEMTVRFGVHYKNIKSVKQRFEEDALDKRNKKNNYTTIIKNKLLYNTNTDKYYVCIFPTEKGTHTKNIYRIIANDVEIISTDNKELVKHLVVDSYWDKGFRETKRIAAENIKRIGNYSFE